MFNFTISRLVYQASLTHYLKTETMLSFEDAAKALDVHSPQNMGSTKSDVFHLDLEDYLAGLIQMSNELSRVSSDIDIKSNGPFDYISNCHKN